MEGEAAGQGGQGKARQCCHWEPGAAGSLSGPPGLAENLQGMAGPDRSVRERRLLQGMIHSLQQEIDKEREAMKDEDLQREEKFKGNRYLLEKQGAPRLEVSVTIRLLEGKRTSPVTGSRSCPPIARGVGGGLQRIARDHFDPHAEGRTREGKSAPSLKGVAKKALEEAAEWALSLPGAAWRILETASSWSGAQGDLARVLRRHRIGEICQAMMETGQKGRETSPGSPKQDGTGLKEGSCRPEEKQVKPVGARARQDAPGSPLKKPSVIRKKIVGSHDAGLVHKDESDNNPRTHKSVPKGHANYE